MAASTKSTSNAKSSSTAPAKASTPSVVEAPATRTVHRNAETGRLVTAEAAAANPKGHVAEALAPNYSATVVNVVQRANGVRVTMDLDLPTSMADVLTLEGAKVRVGISV